jgi:hypothetical protein
MSEHCSALMGCPISRSLVTCCVCLELRSLPSAGVNRTQRYYEPLRHPMARGRSLAGVRLVIPDHAVGLPVLRTFSREQHVVQRLNLAEFLRAPAVKAVWLPPPWQAIATRVFAMVVVSEFLSGLLVCPWLGAQRGWHRAAGRLGGTSGGSASFSHLPN